MFLYLKHKIEIIKKVNCKQQKPCYTACVINRLLKKYLVFVLPFSVKQVIM